MRFFTLSFVIIFLLMLWNLEASNDKKCYLAKTCIHNGLEKCAVNNGTVRRFLDTCDILEFNCLYDTDYTKTLHNKCDKLPPLEVTKTTMVKNKTTRNRFALHHCRKYKKCIYDDETICAIDKREGVIAEFPNRCTFHIVNCYKQGYFKKINTVDCNASIAFDPEHITLLNGVELSFLMTHLPATTQKIPYGNMPILPIINKRNTNYTTNAIFNSETGF